MRGPAQRPATTTVVGRLLQDLEQLVVDQFLDEVEEVFFQALIFDVVLLEKDREDEIESAAFGEKSPDVGADRVETEVEACLDVQKNGFILELLEENGFGDLD